MQLSIYIIVVAIEVYVLLIVANLFLLLHVQKQRQLARRQQDKLQQLISELKQLQLPAGFNPPANDSYQTHLKAQLLATSNRYSGLVSDGDITVEQSMDTSAAAKSLWLRYHFLQAEDMATRKGDGSLNIDWGVFEDQLIKLCSVNTAVKDEDELNDYKKRVQNLEKFRQLFFTMEQQWQEASAKAQEYYQQLLALSSETENNPLFAEVLHDYQQVYSDLNVSFEYGRQNFNQDGKPSAPISVQVARINTQSGEEIIRLRNVAADQHRIINQLQRRLEDAVTVEAKDAVIAELKQQLQRQIRFVGESETCIHVLEQELVVASEKINQQQQTLLGFSETQQELNRAKEMLHQFTMDSKDLVADIFSLEAKNEELERHSSTADQKNQTAEDQQSLSDLQTELVALKTQYIELETKYLDLKLERQ